jgi:alkylation response protein AidB-like acyl-CoA dehydrogenase
MDLRDSPEQAVFRAELREWLARSLPEPDGHPRPGRWDLAVVRAWTAALHAAGYAGLTWPRKYGGQGRSLDFEAIFLAESAAADVPEHIGIIGLGVVGPTILARGTHAQRRHYLPRILSGDIVFCQGFSEPEAGSDLAAVRTRAVRDGDDFVVTGHKLWSSYAHLADCCLLLARTGPADGRHRGLTCLLMDMDAPGVTVRPQRQITGEATFNEILLADVRIPAARVLGEVDDGWGVAMAGLANERGTLGFTLVARFAVALRRLIETARATGQANDPLVRDRIAGLAVDLAGLRWSSYRALSDARANGTPGPESSYLKLCWARGHQRLTALALDLLGPDAVLDGAGGFWDGYWQYHQLRSLGDSIAGGTAEIQRNIIAERILGLPRSR